MRFSFSRLIVVILCMAFGLSACERGKIPALPQDDFSKPDRKELSQPGTVTAVIYATNPGPSEDVTSTVWDPPAAPKVETDPCANRACDVANATKVHCIALERNKRIARDPMREVCKLEINLEPEPLETCFTRVYGQIQTEYPDTSCSFFNRLANPEMKK